MSDIVEVLKTMPGYNGSCGRTDEEICLAEKELKVTFADDYREYLRGIGLACFDGRELTGLTEIRRLDVVEVTKEQRKLAEEADLSWYVIEEANIDGIVIWQGGDGAVYETVCGSKVKIIAASLLEYILKY